MVEILDISNNLLIQTLDQRCSVEGEKDYIYVEVDIVRGEPAELSTLFEHELKTIY